MKKPLLLATAALLLTGTADAASQVDIQGPTGSGDFGRTVTVLPNGNFVVTDPTFSQSNPAVLYVGAVYLYNPDGLLFSTLRGSSANDQVGMNGIVVLANGNFVVVSSSWNGSRGAVTWGSAVSGFIGGASVTVSAANSLVGGNTTDSVGNLGVTPLINGHYVVRSSVWDNGIVVNAGAVTWCNGFTGTVGPVAQYNSLVGTTAYDNVGSSGVTALSNGHYVVRSPFWDNGPISDAGAATWGDGTTGISGPVSDSNSLVGTTQSDAVSNSGVTALTNGNYVVRSSSWDNIVTATVNAGAATWGNGTTGISGPISAGNSLIGSTTDDQVGNSGVTALTNGHYVVTSRLWDNPASAAADAGAATWGNGFTGSKGPVTTANSLVGTTAGDQVGNSGATALANGHYVVRSPLWDNPASAAADAGAATWGNGFTGSKGPVTAANSLVGTTAGDQVSLSGVAALTNGHYVVGSPDWDNNASAPASVNAGAATWGNGASGGKGPISAANSLVGTKAGDQVSSSGITALTNGHYVVLSPLWDNGVTSNVGAVTWGGGVSGIKGPVAPVNSLVGSRSDDRVGTDGVIALPNGNYLVRSGDWSNGGISMAGAITLADGRSALTGPVTTTNSLVGTTVNDRIGKGSHAVLSDSTCLFLSPQFDYNSRIDVGAVTFIDGQTGTAGPITSANSLLGAVSYWGTSLAFSGDPARKQMVVGQRYPDLVTLFRGDRLRTLGLTTQPAPGTADIFFSKPGSAAVNANGHVLADFTLTGAGAAKGKNRALFAHHTPNGGDLVLQSSAPLSSLSSGLPGNAVATALHGQIFHQPNRGVFQATVKGTGISAANNRLLLLDNGISVNLLHRNGSPIALLGGASLLSFKEVLQSYDQDLIVLNYKLRSGGSVNAGNDEGLLFLDHSGRVSANLAARESRPAFDGIGSFGSFNGRAAAGVGSDIHFTAVFKPAGSRPVSAVFSTTMDGTATARLAKGGDAVPGYTGGRPGYGGIFGPFSAISQQNGKALVKAILKNSPANRNEGLFMLPPLGMLCRKGDDITGRGLTITRIVRFWPAGPGQVILHLQVSGIGVTGSNNQVLALCYSNNTYLILLRTGQPAPGTDTAKLATISAVDVNPVSGLYAVLGTLSGSPANANQALWTGDPNLGDGTPANEFQRLPRLTLRKGNTYTTDATPQGIIRSIALKPALDPTGAGGRGLAQALGASGDLAVFITGDRKLTEAVLLDR